MLNVSVSRAVGDNVVATRAILELTKEVGPVNLYSSHPEVWMHHPGVANLEHISQAPANCIPLEYSNSINSANNNSYHFVRGYLNDANDTMRTSVKLSDLRPHLTLSPGEKSIVEPPYWILMAGSKLDFQTKQWDPTNYRRVVDLLPGIKFVSVGASKSNSGKGINVNHIIPKALDLVGTTTLRQLITLIAFSDGVLCGVTSAMHIAAAFNKPCVVVAGGREPWWWEAYNKETWKLSCDSAPPDDFCEHVYFHSIGSLQCSSMSGCGKSRLGCNSEVCCSNVVAAPSGSSPMCMQAVSAEMVVDAIHNYPKTENKLISVSADIKPIATVCVLLYGSGKSVWSNKEQRDLDYHQLHKRVIESVMRHTPCNKYRLFVGCNEVGADTMSWLDRLKRTNTNITLFVEPVNIGKEPIMRRMLACDRRDTAMLAGTTPEIISKGIRSKLNSIDIPAIWNMQPIQIDTEWVVWLDDDVIINRDGWLDDLIGQADAHYVGYPYVVKVDSRELKWMKSRPWWKNINLPLHTDGSQYVEFAQGAFWAAKTEMLKQLNWPDAKLWQHNDDVLLGAAARQNGYKLTWIDEMVESAPATINDCEGRGWKMSIARD